MEVVKRKFPRVGLAFLLYTSSGKKFGLDVRKSPHSGLWEADIWISYKLIWFCQFNGRPWVRMNIVNTRSKLKAA